MKRPSPSPLHPPPGSSEPTTVSINLWQCSERIEKTLESLQEIVGRDPGNRGIKSLIVPGDFSKSCAVLARLPPSNEKVVVILSGFPCCVNNIPPTETDGPGGTVALAKAMMELGHNVVVVTDDCNQSVFSAAMESLLKMPSDDDRGNTVLGASLQIFSSHSPSPHEEEKINNLISSCQLLISCERPGPAVDGNCYTMRGINMTEYGLISPWIFKLVDQRQCQFIAIGDGGNEMCMGKVWGKVRLGIPNGRQIACAVTADYLIVASVSNWGAYALVAGAALIRAADEINNGFTQNTSRSLTKSDLVSHCVSSPHDCLAKWIERCCPKEADQVLLLERCVAAGCRDGVTGRLELTVDGMPFEESRLILNDIRRLVLETSTRW